MGKKEKNQLKLEWHHPGGKLRELCPEALFDVELLSILISTGIKRENC